MALRHEKDEDVTIAYERRGVSKSTSTGEYSVSCRKSRFANTMLL
jgi:hypothetical protein